MSPISSSITTLSPARPPRRPDSLSTPCLIDRCSVLVQRAIAEPESHLTTNPTRTLPREFAYSQEASESVSPNFSDPVLRFPRPLLLPPKPPVWKTPAPVGHHLGLLKTELVYVAGVVAFGLLVGISAVIVGRIVCRKAGNDRIAIPTLRLPNWSSRKKARSGATPSIDAQKFSAGTVTPCSDSETEDSAYGDITPSSSLGKEAASSIQSTLSLQTMQEKFDERCVEEETDIALALQFALREQPSPVIIADSTNQPLDPFAASFEMDDMFTKISLRAGIESAGKRVGNVRTWPASDSEGDFEALSSAGSSDTVSSNDSDSSEDDREREVNGHFVLSTAQSRNVGVNKGVLVSCRSCNSLEKAEKEISKLPTVVTSRASHITRSSYFPESLSSSSSSLNGMLRSPLPSLVVTSPSMPTIPSIPSCTSSVSVDLNEFPVPPTDPGANPISTKIDSSPLFQKGDFEAWEVKAAKASGNRRSTLAQLLRMYTIV